MKIAGRPQNRLRMGLAQHHGAGPTRQHLAQSKTPVDTVGRLGQIAPSGFALADGLVAPLIACLTLTNSTLTQRAPRVPPAVSSIVWAYPASMKRRKHYLQAITEDLGILLQLAPLPVLDSLIVKATHGSMTAWAGRSRRHVGLDRGRQVDRQHPGTSRQLGSLEDRATEKRRLMPACAALEIEMPPDAELVVINLTPGARVETGERIN